MYFFFLPVVVSSCLHLAILPVVCCARRSWCGSFQRRGFLMNEFSLNPSVRYRSCPHPATSSDVSSSSGRSQWSTFWSQNLFTGITNQQNLFLLYRDYHRKPKGVLKSKHIFRTSPKSKHVLSPKSMQKNALSGQIWRWKSKKSSP